MGKKVDRIINRIARNIEPREGQSKRASAIATAKSRGLIKQSGKHLSLTEKGRKA